MHYTRYAELMNNEKAKLSKKERELGWHFCTDWDGLLVGPGMEEEEHCLCGLRDSLTDRE